MSLYEFKKINNVHLDGLYHDSLKVVNRAFCLITGMNGYDYKCKDGVIYVEPKAGGATIDMGERVKHHITDEEVIRYFGELHTRDFTMPYEFKIIALGLDDMTGHFIARCSDKGKIFYIDIDYSLDCDCYGDIIDDSDGDDDWWCY